jgi:hypothetical protein
MDRLSRSFLLKELTELSELSELSETESDGTIDSEMPRRDTPNRWRARQSSTMSVWTDRGSDSA